MKKTYSIFAIVSSLLLLNSCAKESTPGDSDVTGEEQTITLRAVIHDESVKTVLGDETGHKSISWAENDSVKIFYGTTATAFKDAGIGENGEINIKVQTATYKNFFGVYPHTASCKMVNSTNVVGAVTVPGVQNGVFADACLMVAWATNDRILRFHTAVSMITLEVEDPTITQIVIRANDGTPLAGQAEFTFDKTTGEITKIVHSNGCTAEVTLNVKGPGKYYVGVLPDVNLKAGIGFKVVKGTVSAGALSRTPLKLSRTELMSVGKVEDRTLPEGDIFIKAGGLGKGTSWSDAGGVDLLNSLLDIRVSDSVSFDGVTTLWKLAGKKIYLAQGKYNLTGADGLPFAVSCGSGSLEVCGGFSEGSIGKDLSKYDPELYPTVFSSDDGVRIMDAGGLSGGSFSFTGIKFSDANTKCDGAAVAVESQNATFNFKDCTFSSNTTTKNGAGLCVTNGTVNLGNCSFTDNMGVTTIEASNKESAEYHNNTSHGGAIFATGKNAKLYISNCMFKKNVAFVGADIELWYGADAYVYDCAFISSVAQAGGYFGIYPGRSINLDAMENGYVGRLCMCNCTLTKTSSAYTSNGGLPIISPTNYFCMLVNCTLHDGAVASLRNNNYSSRTSVNPDLIWLIANLFVNSSGNAINLGEASNRHGYYNMLEKGKNAYAELDPTDTKIAESEFASMKFISDKGYYTWAVDEKVKTINRPTQVTVEDVVKTNCADFYNWLNKIKTNPFGYDQTGTARNPGAINPGAWDKGF